MNPSQAKATPHFELADVWNSFTERERQRVNATLAHTPEDAESVLDVGCGDGRFLHLLRHPSRQLVGMDYCFEPLRRVQTPRLQGSATQLPFRSATFDLVISTEMLEHLSREAFTEAVAEMARVSRRYVMLTVPYRENLLEELCRCADCRRAFHKYGHTRSFDQSDLEALGTNQVTKIVPIRKTRRLTMLYWLQHKFGSKYNWDGNTRCPHCGGEAQPDTGNAFGRLVQRVIWYLDKRFPKIEDGWLVAVRCKINQERQ